MCPVLVTQCIRCYNSWFVYTSTVSKCGLPKIFAFVARSSGTAGGGTSSLNNRDIRSHPRLLAERRQFFDYDYSFSARYIAHTPTICAATASPAIEYESMDLGRICRVIACSHSVLEDHVTIGLVKNLVLAKYSSTNDRLSTCYILWSSDVAKSKLYPFYGSNLCNILIKNLDFLR